MELWVWVYLNPLKILWADGSLLGVKVAQNRSDLPLVSFDTSLPILLDRFFLARCLCSI